MFSDSDPRKNKIRVLVADSSRIHTHLLADALKRDPLLEAIPFDSDSRSLVAAMMGLDIEVLVISPNLDEQPFRGLEVVRELRAVRPVRAVVLLDSMKDEAVLDAFRAGARGIFSKSQPADVLSKCVRCVYQGQIWANSEELALAVEALASAPNVRAVNASGMSLLSKRELQVVRCLAEGMTNREIAERLKLSQHTVKNYLFRVFDKLGVSSRVELLFMTLVGASVEPARKKSKPSESAASADEFTLFMQGAESGLPLPQLALAQMYVCLQKEPRDLVQAYAWYLLATDGVAQIKAQMEKTMTAKQIGDAQAKAKSWL